MTERPSPGGFSAGYVEARLESAGRSLIALPIAGSVPAGMRTLWPWPQASAAGERRWGLPLAREITEMDEAYRWCELIADVDRRRLVLMRSLVFPDSPADFPRYRYSWRSLARQTGLHRDTLMMRWGRGIDEIVVRLNRPGFCMTAARRAWMGGSPRRAASAAA